MKFGEIIAAKTSATFSLLLQLKKRICCYSFLLCWKSFSPLAEKDCCHQQHFFDEVLQKQFQPKTQKCGKFGPFLRIDQKTERFFSSRSGENPFLPLAKKIFDFIFAPLAEKIFCLLQQQKTKFCNNFSWVCLERFTHNLTILSAQKQFCFVLTAETLFCSLNQTFLAFDKNFC